MMNKIQDFISNRKKETVIAVCILILILLIIILAMIFGGNKRAKMSRTDTKIDPNVLWLLEEPLYLPPIQFSREQRKIWEEEEIEYWYEPPSKQIMEMLNKKNKNLVDNILEAAP